LIEASTNEEEASGLLAFSRASCRPGATVSFSVHALLGSELFEGREVRVDGSFTGTVEDQLGSLAGPPALAIPTIDE
jgi:hypothetical protein